MTTSQAKSSLPHIVALGGGFGSMFLYKKLAGEARRKQIRLTVIDKNNYNCFHGMVPEMIAGKNFARTAFSIPCAACFAMRNSATGRSRRSTSTRKRSSTAATSTARNSRIAFDYLFLNVGSVENFSLFPGIREHTLRLKQYPDILQARHHLITMLELADIEEDSGRGRAAC